jgi:hypothetical protein
MSMTVGRLDDRILTSREVQIQILLEKFLFENIKLAELRTDPLDSKAFFNSINDSILEGVLTIEAKNFDVVQADDNELLKMQAKVSNGLTATSVWKKLEPTVSEWHGVLEHKIKAKHFVAFRRESSQLPVTDVEAKRYFEENRIKFGNLPFDNFRENIKSYLTRSQVDRRLKDWYEILKTKYRAKNFLSEL